jgi:hypothetical protein
MQRWWFTHLLDYSIRYLCEQNPYDSICNGGIY